MISVFTSAACACELAHSRRVCCHTVGNDAAGGGVGGGRGAGRPGDGVATGCAAAAGVAVNGKKGCRGAVGCGVGAFDGLGVGDWNEISRAMERKNGVRILNVCVGKEIIR